MSVACVCRSVHAIVFIALAPHYRIGLASSLLPMNITFLEYANIEFPVWREMWFDYVGLNATNMSAGVHEHTFLRIRNAEGNLFGVAAFTDRPVGFAHYYFHPSTYSIADACTLEDLYVSPQARGQGIGSALVGVVAARARKLGAPALNWKTRSSNEAAISLYERLASRTDFLSFRLALCTA